ncbi:hypothetical protein [Pedobacter steynii]
MNAFTTHFYKDGLRWSGCGILATDWDVAEYIASMMNVKVTGKLVMEVDCDDDFNINWSTSKYYS